MAAGKEIRTKIQSIKNTQKITSAMEMVAASKMRKAQDRMATSRPYATKIQQVIGHLAWGHSEYHHPYLAEREVKERVGFIVVSTDRGLCGGLNANLFKKIVNEILDLEKKKVEVELCIIGKKAEAFFKRFNNIAAVTTNLGDAPSVEALIGVIKVMLDRYDDNKLDALHLFYNEFENTMSQRPAKTQLLPLLATEEEAEEFQHHWDYIYEPDAKELLDVLLTRYIESQVYQAVVENIASEQAARMVAMKSATDNAGDLINEFQLVYNKARQAAITQEISEIVGGAAAV